MREHVFGTRKRARINKQATMRRVKKHARIELKKKRKEPEAGKIEKETRVNSNTRANQCKKEIMDQLSEQFLGVIMT